MNDTAFVLALVIALAYYFGKTRRARKSHKAKDVTTKDESSSRK